MARLLLIYDISEDKARSRVANACQDYGLDRIQFSAFAGELSRNHQEELMLRIHNLLEESGGNVQLIPICSQDWAGRLEIRYA